MNTQHPIDNMATESKPHFRIQRFISLAATGASLVISLLVSLGVGNMVYANLKEKNGQALAEIAFHMSETLDNGIYERFGDLLQMSHRLDFVALIKSPHLLQSYFEHQQRLFPEYAWLGFVDPDGTVRAGSGGLLEGKDISSREWVKAGMQAPHAGDVHDAVLLSALLPSPQDGEPLRLVDVALPVHDNNNNLLGVMGAHLSWQWVKDVRKNLLTHNLISRKIEIIVLNSKGSVLLGSSGNASNGIDLSQLESFRHAREFKVGSVFEQWSDGNWYNTGYARGKGRSGFTGLNWIVLARQSESVARVEAAAIRQKVLLLGMAIGLLAGVVSWFSVRWALQPLEQAAGAARRIGRENGVPPVSLSLTRRDEIALFAGTMYEQLADIARSEQQLLLENTHLWGEVERFKTVEYRLAELRRGLELRVLERTADLQDTTQALTKVRDEAEQARREMDRKIVSMDEIIARAKATLNYCHQQLERHPANAGLLVEISQVLDLLRTSGDHAPGKSAQVDTSPPEQEMS